MKKYMIMCMAVVALLFASCKNEDISISREVMFDVNPYEVIVGFVPHEVYEGDLADLYSTYKLRVHLLVYDAQGDLVDSDIRYFDNYRSTMNAKFNLADGNYTVVATTDVVRYNGTPTLEFWTFQDFDRLSKLQINDAGYLGSEVKILGVGNQRITVKAGNTSYHINMKPAGALVLAQIWDINAYEGIDSYNLMSNKSSRSCTFNEDGSCNTYYEDASFYHWYLKRFYPANFTSYGGYGYNFTLPLGTANFIWTTDWVDGNNMVLTDAMPLTVEAGKMYQFVLDMSELTYYWGEMGDKSIPSYSGEPLTRMSTETSVTESISEK